MRALVLATALAGLVLFGAAEARPWTDPAGRISFEAPEGWAINQPRTTSDSFTYVIVGNANNECQFMATASPANEAATAESMRRLSGEQERFGVDVWVRVLGSFSDVFRGAAPQIVSTSVDMSGFWPIQRAEARAGERPVHAAFQARPGVEIITACLTFGGAEPLDLYDQVIRSVGHPNDGAWRTEIEGGLAPPP